MVANKIESNSGTSRAFFPSAVATLKFLTIMIPLSRDISP